MPEAKQVLFAEVELTIHKKMSQEPMVDTFGNENWHVESTTLLPGEFVSLDDLPPYLVDDLKKKKVEGGKLTTETQAKKIAKRAKEIREAAAQAKVVVDTSSTVDADSVKLASSLLEE